MLKKDIIVEKIIDLILLCSLIAASLKLTYAVGTFMDIGLDDESLYLYNGIKLIKDAQWGPLYSLWYHLLSLLEKNAIALYYLNYRILICATTVALYAYLRRIKVVPLIACVASFLYLISPVPYQWPYCSYFALLVLLSFLILTTFTRSEEMYYSLVGSGLLLVSFVRPEYFVSYIIICIIFLFYILRNIKSVRHVPVILSFVIISSALLYYYGFPLYGNRSWIAFGMRYSHNFCTWNHLIINPWTHWVQITRLVFGDANTVMNAAMNNSGEFFRHISYNAGLYIRNILHMPLPRFENFLPPTIIKAIKGSTALFIGGTVFFICKRSAERKMVSDRTIIDRLLILICAVSLPTVLSVLIVYPTYHYLIIQVTMIMALLTYLASCAITNETQTTLKKVFASVFLGTALFFLTPNMIYGWSIMPSAISVNKNTAQTQPTLTTIKFIRSLNISKKVNMLEAEGGLFMYLGDNYKRIAQFDKKEPFNSFIEKNGVNMIVVDSALKKDTRFSTDKEFASFLARPDSLSFVKIQIPGTGRSLFIKKDLTKGV